MAVSVGGYFWWSSNPKNSLFPTLTPNNENLTPEEAKKTSLSGIYGTATFGPTCPVQRIGELCEKPYQGTIVIGKNILIPSKPDRFEEKTRFQTNSDGSFRVNLPPGDYVAKAPGVGFDRFNFSKISAHVEENKFSKIDILFDTGIR